MLERLERRDLFAITYSVNGEIIDVTGGGGADEIVVRQEAGELVIVHDGVRQAVPTGTLRFLNINGGAGRDRLTVETAALNVLVSGGRGNDRIEVGAAASCTVSGDQGRDRIFGSAGDDALFGGPGNDVILGRGGNDRIAGDGGDDTLDGGDGNDHLYDRRGDDRLFGGGGNDTLSDGEGSNRFSGGDGADECTLRPNARPVPDDVETLYRVRSTDVHPRVDAFVTRSADGEVSVVVDASHPAGGYRRTFGSLERTPAGFRVDVLGIDLAGRRAGRTQALEVDTRTYALGRLPPGTYEFVIHSRGGVLKSYRGYAWVDPTPGEVRKLFRMGVTADGLTPDTPTTPGPYHPLTPPVV